MSKNWFAKNYRVGTKVSVPHPSNNEDQEATITNHTTDSVGHPFPKGPTGIIVQFEDGVFMEIEQGYLHENGGGIV